MEDVCTFCDFKLSSNIINALKEMNFLKPTKVQLKTIPVCLKGKDVVVQAKTGSGKTLAFLLPLLENLLRLKSNSSFGIQAIILVPTAELASQTLNVLSKLLKFCPNITFISAVGGKAHTGKKEEWKKIDASNIVVSTIGRFLEHIEKNVNLNLSNLRYLVIDETDYLMEKNFFIEMESLLNSLPKDRVTWLFSATQISDDEQFKRLSLNCPDFIGIDSNKIMIPKNLVQTYMKIELHDKIQALWNLLDAQNDANIIVFFSTQKQVLYMYRLFTSLNPPYKVLQLRSNMRLDKRIFSVHSFGKSNKGCVLFATDIASRGLDFPRVSLVVQYDLPKDFDDYVHRSGRTARFNARGLSVLMIMPSEVGFLSFLKDKNITLKQISGNILKSGHHNIAEKAAIKYSNNVELFKMAKNAFLAYLRDYAKIPFKYQFNNKTEDIFVVKLLNVKKFARSFGFKTIPDELTELGIQNGVYSSVKYDDRPFFVVKRKLTNKRKLDLTDDEDNFSEENENIDSEEIYSPDNSKTNFIFEEIYNEFISFSTNDKKYFNTVIKPKYGKRKKIFEDE